MHSHTFVAMSAVMATLLTTGCDENKETVEVAPEVTIETPATQETPAQQETPVVEEASAPGTAKVESDIIAVPAPPADGDVIVTVGEYTMTWGELNRKVNLILEQTADRVPADQLENLREIARQRVVETFVIDCIVKVAAQSRGITVTDEMRQKAYAEFEKAQGISLEEALKQMPPAMAEMNRANLEARLLERALMDQEVLSKIVIDDAVVATELSKLQTQIKLATEDIDLYHKQLVEKTLTIDELAQKAPHLVPPQARSVDFAQKDLATMPPVIRQAIEATTPGNVTAIIDIPPPAEGSAPLRGFFVINKAVPEVTEASAKTLIDSLKARLDAGESFEALAAEYSACPSGQRGGGDLGEFSRGMMVKEFEDAAYAQPLNVVGDPVKTNFGYHLIKVTKRDDASGKVQASHILIAPKSAALNVTPVLCAVPEMMTEAEIREGLKMREGADAARAYFEKLRDEVKVSSTLYPQIAR